MIKKPWQYVAGTILSLLASAISAWGTQFVYARIYAHQMGVPLDTLSEDYNLGFKTFLVTFVSLLTTLVAGAWLTHRIASSNT